MPYVNPFQALVDHVNNQAQKQRAAEQMTLGEFISLLESLPADRHVEGLGELSSYRGYYNDLAFEPDNREGTMGRTFEGYKGGEYVMGEHTPLWVSAWDEASGMKLMGLDTRSDPITPVTKQEEW